MTRAEIRTYGRTRVALYPDTYRDTHPSAEVKDDKKQYIAADAAAEESINEYRLQYKHHAGNQNILDLSEAKHSTLMAPASDAAVDTEWHVNT